jgi:hypothetical protein
MRFLSLILVSVFFTHSYGQAKKILVSSHVNIEVINALTISLYPEMLQDSVSNPWMFENTQLMRLAHAYFRPYESDPAVGKATVLIRKLGTGIYLLGLYYEDLPKVKRKIEIPEIIWSEISHDRDSALSIIDDFFISAAAFYKTSRFQKFQHTYRNVYSKALQQIHQYLPGDNFIPLLEKYYGEEKQTYNIILMPFFKSDWGMGWETLSGSKKNIYNITSPFGKQIVVGSNVKETGFNNKEKILNLCIHEFGHSFVNPLTSTEPFLSEIKKFDSLFKPIQSEGQYSDWVTMFNEYVVRAGEIVVMRELGNAEFANKTRENYKQWIYLDYFIDELTRYTRERDKYKSFKEFLPALINNMQKLRQTHD